MLIFSSMFVDCCSCVLLFVFFFFFQAEDGIRDLYVTGVQTCALPIYSGGLERHYAPRTPSRLVPTHALDAEIARHGEKVARSEERRVGKECRSRGSPDH